MRLKGAKKFNFIKEYHWKYFYEYEMKELKLGGDLIKNWMTQEFWINPWQQHEVFLFPKFGRKSTTCSRVTLY